MSGTFAPQIVFWCILLSTFLTALAENSTQGRFKKNATVRFLRAAVLRLARLTIRLVPSDIALWVTPSAVWFSFYVLLFAYQARLIEHIPLSLQACVLIGFGISAVTFLAGTAYGAENTAQPQKRPAFEKYRYTFWLLPALYYPMAAMVDPWLVEDKGIPILYGYLMGLATAGVAVALFVYVQSLVRTATDDGRQTDDTVPPKTN